MRGLSSSIICLTFTEANTANLKPAREFIEQALGLITAPAQQQTCGLAFVRQHLLGKD